jgi:hypothetical protein
MEWVSVKNRLPVRGDSVLVSADGILWICKFGDVNWKGEETDDFIPQEAGCGCCSKDIKPQYWTELPDGPKD